jgi:hypothetical protein
MDSNIKISPHLFHLSLLVFLYWSIIKEILDLSYYYHLSTIPYVLLALADIHSSGLVCHTGGTVWHIP